VQTLSDESLLAGLGSGDPAASAAFVSRFRDRVFGLTYSILRDRGAAEEAAQEAFVRAWKYSKAFDPKRGAVAPWLLTIARNVSIDMLPRRPVDPMDPEVLIALEGKNRDDPEEESPFLEREAVRDALAGLPDDQRRVLILAVLYGYTAREISEMDTVPLGTVKTRIRAGLMKLRRRVAVGDE
jgi:RNA polymerase sigma-70 factor (ECF subfamily)